MDYTKDILNRLLDMYERREAFNQDASTLRAIQIEVKKAYPAYEDRYNHDVYKDINVAIEKLSSQNMVISEQNNSGKYEKVRLNVFMVEESYKSLKRVSIPEQCEKVQHILKKYENAESLIIQNVIRTWTKLIADYKKLPYDLKIRRNFKKNLKASLNRYCLIILMKFWKKIKYWNSITCMRIQLMS